MAIIRESLARGGARWRAGALACTAIAVGALGAGVAAGCGDEDTGLEPVVTNTSSQEELEKAARDAKRKARELEKTLDRELPNP